jgi:hypothetical protein
MPKYVQIHIKSADTSEAAKRTETQVRTLKIKNEIKFLYKKKQQLNKELYTLHLLNANNEWGNIWNIIAAYITDALENAMKHKYNNINRKVQSLRNEQGKDTQPTTYTFHKNLINIIFTNDETQLLSKGLKYNLHHEHSN